MGKLYSSPLRYSNKDCKLLTVDRKKKNDGKWNKTEEQYCELFSALSKDLTTRSFMKIKRCGKSLLSSFTVPNYI